MTVDSVITLDNDVNCLLLEKVNFETDNYFLSVVLNEDEEPSDEYVIFKEIIENNENYVDSNNKWKNIDPARLVERWFRIDL